MSLTLLLCTIIAVHDGDTLTANCQKRAKPVVIRLAEVDAPEMKAFTWGEQPGARAATAASQALCMGQPAKVRLWKYDSRTKRWIAYVECRGMDLSTQLVARGLAWSYLPAKKSDMPALMKAAQDQRVGLWAPGSASIPPTTWRKTGAHQ